MKKEKWEDGWLYWEDKDSFALLWDIPEHAVNVTIPHDTMISQPAYKESMNGGSTGYRDGGNYCYVKRFFVPEDAAEKSMIFRFDGIYMNALVYINEQFAGQCPNGYSVFYVDADDYLVCGQENEIRIFAKTGAMTNSRWYSGSGIYRDVYCITGEKIHIVPDMVRVTCEHAESSYALLNISSEIENQCTRKQFLRLKTTIEDHAGNLKAEDICQFHIPAGGKRTVRQRLIVEDPQMWDADSPILYCCKSCLLEAETVIDENETNFGIRTLELDAKRGLRVNGKEVKLRGACIHHDSGILGAATYEQAQFRQIRKLKEAGFNAVRMSHNPMAPAMLKACDEIGMYVMDEFSDMWSRGKNDFDYTHFFQKWWEEDIHLLVRKDYNHPSVILYSMGNEIPEIDTDYGEALCCKLAQEIKREDPTRYTLLAVNGFFGVGKKIHKIVDDVEKDLISEGEYLGTVNDFLAKVDMHVDRIVLHPLISDCLKRVDPYLDIVGYNYMANRYPMDLEENPNRVIVGSETYPPTIARNWKLVKKLSNVIGDFTWTGWDYIGEAGIGIPGYRPGEGGMGAQFPCQISYCGDLDLTGFRRPMSYLREIVFGLCSAPYIAVQRPEHYHKEMVPSPWILSDTVAGWTWKGYEGKPVVVEVYSAGTEVELFQNGISLGKRAAGADADFRILYETEYTPGILEAVSYDKDKEIGRQVLSTVDSELEYIMQPEEISDAPLIYINITYCDQEHHCVIGEDQEITVTCRGDAEILGLGSGDPKPQYSYNGGVCTTWNGRALLILKRKKEKEKGYIDILLNSADGKTAELKICEED